MIGSLYMPHIRFIANHGIWECRSRWKLDADHVATATTANGAFDIWLITHPDILVRGVGHWTAYLKDPYLFGMPALFIKAKSKFEAIDNLMQEIKSHLSKPRKSNCLESTLIQVDVIGRIEKYSKISTICRYNGKLFACKAWRFRGSGDSKATVVVKRFNGNVVLPNPIGV